MDFSRLAGKSFVIIGRAGMDFYPDPPGTKTELGEQFVAHLGGSSGNIGVALNKLGCRSSLVTTVSDDAIGRFVLNQLDRYGVARDHVKVSSGEWRTSLAVVESRVDDHQSVIYRNNAADFQMEKADVEAVNYADFDGLITTGTVLAAQPSRSACFHAFKLARDAGIPLLFDVDYRPYSWVSPEDAADTYAKAASFCDAIIGNDEEFGVMAGGYEKGLEFARHLAQDGDRVVVYKMGEKGSITITRKGEFETGIFPVTALKPTGAGDSFMGGFVAALAGGYDLRDAVVRGSACAAMVVTSVGCAPAMPTGDQLDKFLSDHEQNSPARKD